MTRFPFDAWYAVAHSEEVGRSPVGRIAHGAGIVLYRTSGGGVVALADRCAHRPYPLSLGRVEGDLIVSSYSGFAYGPDGRVVSVPTQQQVPVGAAVRAYPSVEYAGLLWVWTGNPGLAERRPLTALPWLTEPGWTTFGADWETAASGGLLQDNFADITHVPHLHPVLSPPVLRRTPPRLHVEVSEQQVRFWRDFPAAHLQTWQSEATGLSAEAEFEQHEEGLFASPGLWTDRWDVLTSHGPKTMHFTHAITPVDDRRTQHFWTVSRNFALDRETTGILRPLLEGYYRTVKEALEVMQTLIDREGPAKEVSVRADAAMLEVRRVMRRLLKEDTTR
ncbi:aromatic ring-hydroxylating dioxygenase subunit alpha [Streptomyces zhihengii]|uniref:Rieske 2Fe-2S domain-containing protein n=1 Tax=Streptomyces zhihengii TaxID=1818004 RepID=A0ABS2V458_9ACTN|nr:Rieske 2Fe-2S domain-containing protein [Streptomyces zhihengii]MBM9624621.1 Rieske 2Fe-2S domain-containing protein [Streptomyces zhihengii]